MSLLIILVPTLLYTVFTFMRLNFLTLKSFKTIKDVNTTTSITSVSDDNKLYYFYLLVITFLLINLNNYFTYSLNLINVLQINPTSLIILLFCLLSSMAYIAFFFSLPQTILLNFVLIFSLITSLLLITGNLFQFYIILEILAYTNILFFILFKLSVKSASNQWLIASIISFLLNFLTSIIFFSFIVLWTWQTNYPSWDILHYFSSNFIQSLTISLFVLLKLGVGPWLLGNFHSYLGYNLYYLLTYTVNMLLIVTPILVILYGLFGFKSLTLLFVTYAYIYIASTLSSVKSLKGLFAYSTVIIYTYLFLICIF